MDLSMEIDEDDCNKLIKSTPKKNRSKVDDGDVVTSSKKRKIRGIMLSVTKPSYTLKKGIGRDIRSLRWEHRNRLRYLLRQLVRHQNWDEASGVLSVLLKATHKENNLPANRTKYWATLELLQHMGAAKVKPRKIQNVYEIWMKKNLAVTKNRRFLKQGRFDVQLEFLLFCLSRGDTDGAYQAVISLMQESDFTSEPIANLVAGLVFSHLWYKAIQKEMELYDSPESCTPIQSGMLGSHQIMSIDNSNRQGVVKIQSSESPFQQDSNTSVRLGKAIDIKEVVDQNRGVPMEVDDGLKKEIAEYEEPHMNSIESDQSGKVGFPYTGNKRYGSIFYASDLEHLLMPLRFTGTKKFEDFISLQKRIHNDNYKASVKYLRCALHSTPPAFEALLPLIQMLLLGDQVKEAMEEVESVVQNSDAALPFRLKASLLEHLSREDAVKLCTCFEDTLKKDPTCSHSLAKLISLHRDGYYSIEKVLEMIALHLDATYADSHIWKEFASCFIRISLCNEDTMSSCGGGDEERYGNRSNSISDMFKDCELRRNWRLRCRWWSTRYFTQTLLASEVTSGNMELLTYKAAVACHFYGPEFAYVTKAREFLEKEKNREMLSILKMHICNTIRLYTS